MFFQAFVRLTHFFTQVRGAVCILSCIEMVRYVLGNALLSKLMDFGCRWLLHLSSGKNLHFLETFTELLLYGSP
jgi:hypothetical protein